MSIFSNIHRIASRVIPRTDIEYRIAGASTTDAYGVRKSTYGAWTTIRAHVQPGIISSFGGKNIEERDYKDMGLDFSHRFITVWCDNIDISTLAKKDSADQIKVGNSIFNIIQVADWLDFSGWKRIFCEEVIP